MLKCKIYLIFLLLIVKCFLKESNIMLLLQESRIKTKIKIYKQLLIATVAIRPGFAGSRNNIVYYVWITQNFLLIDILVRHKYI